MIYWAGFIATKAKSMKNHLYGGIYLEMKTHLKTWEGTQAENKVGRALGGAVNHRVTAGHQGFTKDTIVTMQPYTLSEEAWVTKENYLSVLQRSLGLCVLTAAWRYARFGGFCQRAVEPRRLAEIYQDVIDAIGSSPKQIKEDRVTMRFEPRL